MLVSLLLFRTILAIKDFVLQWIEACNTINTSRLSCQASFWITAASCHDCLESNLPLSRMASATIEFLRKLCSKCVFWLPVFSLTMLCLVQRRFLAVSSSKGDSVSQEAKIISHTYEVSSCFPSCRTTQRGSLVLHPPIQLDCGS